MNNLKRVLSLALSTVMLVGMMAMGASAAEFSDADDIQHDDAVNTLVALSVINGKDDGSFDPQGDVTRAEMAKMIAVAMNGGKDTNTGVKGTPSFTDIKGHWAESYIEYCYDLNIISGRGDGTFDPGANVTGLEATKMVLTALGYDATAYRLTGASWAVRTDELAKAADPNLYEELGGVVMATNASRDTAAQLIWNGMQNTTRRVIPSTNTSTGETTWSYQTSTSTMLKERYGAEIYTGTYVGNFDTSAASNEGEIAMNGELDRDETVNGPASFPSDMDISNIGEEIKVIFKDGKGGTAGKPDKNDTIFGVFNTGRTQVINTTVNDVKNGDSAAPETDRIKIGDTKYKIATPESGDVLVEKNYDSEQRTTASGANAAALLASAKTAFEGLNASQKGDTIKFVCNTDGEITTAYVVNYNIGYVTATNSSKVSLSGSNGGSIDRDDNDIYDGVAKNDIVVYTKFYSTDRDDAFYTVTKAETVEGELRSYKNADNFTLDGTNYKVLGKSFGSAVTIGDNTTVVNLEDKIGEDFTAYLVNGYVGYLVQSSESLSNYALVTDVNDGSLDSTFKPAQAQLLLADGSKVTANIHKDSVIKAKDAADYDNGGAQMTTDSNDKLNAFLEIGQLVKYSVSGSTYKIEEIGTYSTGTSKVYDKDLKTFAGTVTSGDCPLFVNENGSYKVYNVRDLNDVTPEAVGGKTFSASYANGGKVVAAFVTLQTRPSGTSSNTFYGIVSGGGSTVKDGDETYKEYTVENDQETVTVKIGTNYSLTTGSLVYFDRTSDDVYNQNTTGRTADIKAFDGTDLSDAGKGLAAWVSSYEANDKTITYFTEVTGNETDGYKGTETGGKMKTAALDDDCVIVYVDADNKEAGSDISIDAFDAVTPYRNVLLVADSSGKITAIFVESSREADILDADWKDLVTTTNPDDEDEDDTVEVTGAALTPTTVTLTAAEATDTVTVSNIEPDNATDKTVTAESADETKVTVEVAGTTITVKAVAGLTNAANGEVKVTVKVGGVEVGQITVTINIA